MQIRDRSSLAPCDENRYSNIYTVRRHPDYKPAPSSTQPIHKDTLQISKDEIKKEALKRLQHTSKYLVLQHGFMRIGKYLFLAVAFPPYFALYKIPRWILVEGFPVVFSFLSNLTGKTVLPLKQRIDLIIQKLTYVLQLIQGTLRGLIQPIVNIGLAFQNVLRRTRQKILNGFSRVRQGVQRLLSGPKRMWGKITQVFGRARQGFVQTQQWIGNQLMSMWGPVRESWNWLKALPKRVKLPKPKRFKLEAGASFLKPFKAKFQLAQQFAQRTTNWVAQKWKPVQQKLDFIGEQIAKVYRRYIRPPFKQIHSWLTKGREFLKNKHDNFLKKIFEKRKKLQTMSSQDIIDYFSSPAFLSWLPAPIRMLFKFIFWNQVIQQLVRGIIFVVTYVLKGFEVALQAWEKMLKFFAQMVRTAVGFLMTGLSKAFSYPLAFLSFMSKISHKAFYWTLVVLAMSAILFAWGIQLLGQTSHRVFSRLNLNLRQ